MFLQGSQKLRNLYFNDNVFRFSNVNDDDHHNAERYMRICPNTLDNNIQACPDVYPWLGNPCGGNSPCLD